MPANKVAILPNGGIRLNKKLENRAGINYMKKWDFESDNPEIYKALNDLEKVLIKHIGKPCKRKAVGCFACKVWACYDVLKMNFY